MKRLSGTLRKDRVNQREPRPPRGHLTPRRGTPAAVRRQFGWLVGLLDLMPGVATHADAAQVELAAYALAEYHAAAAIVFAQGHTYTATTEAGSVMHRARPEVAIAGDAWRRAHAALQTFGLSPTSRAKVEGEVLPPAPPREQQLGQGAAPASRSFQDPLDQWERRRAELRLADPAQRRSQGSRS